MQQPRRTHGHVYSQFLMTTIFVIFKCVNVPHFLNAFFSSGTSRLYPQFLVITNKTAMNIVKQVSFCGMLEHLLGICSGVV